MEIRTRLIFGVTIAVAVLSGCTRVGLQSGAHPLRLANNPLLPSSHNRLAVLSADYQAHYGELSVVQLSEPDPSLQILKAQYPVSGDAVVRWFSELPYYFVVNRLGEENIQVFGPNDLKSAVPQFSMTAVEATRQSPNLQDIILDPKSDGTIAYLTALNSDRVLKINPLNGQKLGEISLGEYADVDGLPEMTQTLWVNQHLWVLLQRMDRGKDLRKIPWDTTDYSAIAVIDPKTNQVLKIIHLTGKDPVLFKLGNDGLVYVASWGGMAANSGGGLETIDPRRWESRGLVASETALGGKPLDFDFSLDGFWVLVETPAQNTQLVKYVSSLPKAFLVYASDAVDRLQAVLYDSERDLVFLATRALQSPGVIILNAKTYDEVCFFSVGIAPQQLLWGH